MKDRTDVQNIDMMNQTGFCRNCLSRWYQEAAAERGIELMSFDTVVAATDNDAYNTLVATDLAPEFGRENVYQVAREKAGNIRHSLPASLGGRNFGGKATFNDLNRMMWEGWTFRITRLSEEYSFEEWRDKRPNARLLAEIDTEGQLRFLGEDDEARTAPGTRLVSMLPPEEDAKLKRTG